MCLSGALPFRVYRTPLRRPAALGFSGSALTLTSCGTRVFQQCVDAHVQMDVHQRWQAHIVVVQPVVCTMLRSPRAITHSQVPSDQRPVQRDGAVLTSAGTARNDRRAAPLACRRGPASRREQEAGLARVGSHTPRLRRSARRCSAPVAKPAKRLRPARPCETCRRRSGVTQHVAEKCGGRLSAARRCST